MNIQETFNKVSSHLLCQNERCALQNDKGNFVCHYERNGLRCAVGALIPDNHPGLTYLGSVGELLKEYPDLNVHVGNKDATTLELLDELQDLHDSKHVRDWKDCLEDLAQQYDLEWNHE